MRSGDTFPLHYSFRLPTGDLLKVTYQATIESADDSGPGLYWVRLGPRQALEWPESRAPEPHTLERLDALVGKRAKIPEEALTGTRLPMKYRTLTGEIPYFR